LREGIDLPEVSLVCILDADKEGYLRSNRSLVQTIGRAARHLEGRVIMYADRVTLSMQNAIDETYRRRAIQEQYNEAHGISPEGIHKAIRDITDHVRMAAEEKAEYDGMGAKEMPKDEILRMVKELESQMKSAAKALEFEKAAALRDQVVELRRQMVGSDEDELAAFAAVAGRGGPVRYGRSQAGGRTGRAVIAGRAIG
jgi:excinuclease ABC subunit B